jgi:outer membrane protein
MKHLLAAFLLVSAPVGLFASEAQAADTVPRIATVDFQRALNEVAEGAQARTRLETLHAEKKATVEKLQKSFQAQVADFEKQKLVLGEGALRQRQQELMQLQAQAEGMAAQAEQEMRQAYYGAMETLITRMKKIAADLGKEKSYSLVIEVNGDAVVYAAPGMDLTDEVIRRYNAANPVQGASATGGAPAPSGAPTSGASAPKPPKK